MSLVNQRLVFFINGFDPKGASSFYQQHKLSCAVHAQLHGGNYRFSPRVASSSHSCKWSITTDQPSGKVHTQFDYLVWDDLVRQQWARTPTAIVQEAAASLVDFVCQGTVARLYRHSKNVVRAALFPYALFLCSMVLVGLGAWGASAAAHWAGVPQSAVVATALFAAMLGSYAALKVLQRVPSTWFLRVVAFARHYASAQQADHAMQQRISVWSQHIAAQLQSTQAQEVLLIGYSAGSILSTAVMARLLQTTPGAAQQVILVTLGNSIPVPAALKQATHLRQDLSTLHTAQVRWLDVSSPIDWGSFSNTDPVALFTPNGASKLRKFISPQWHLLFSPTSYQMLKKDKYRVHKQYLQTTEILGTYDYFALTCGSRSIQNYFQ